MTSALTQSDSPTALHPVECVSQDFHLLKLNVSFPKSLLFPCAQQSYLLDMLILPGWKPDFLVGRYQVALCGSQTFFCNGSYSSSTVEIALHSLQLQFTRFCHMLRSFTSELLQRFLPNVTQFWRPI